MALSLSTWLLISLFVPLFIGVTINVVVTVAPLNTNLDSWSGRVTSFTQDSLDATQLVKAKNIADTLADLTGQVSAELNVAISYAQDQLRGRYPVVNYYRTYYGIQAIDSTTPGSFSAPVSVSRASTTFKYGTTTMAQLMTTPFINETSLIDNIWQAILRANPRYSKLYIGLESDLHRQYPYTRLENFPSISYTCAGGGGPTVGYLPRCQPYYYEAKQVINQNRTVFLPPMLVGGQATMTASRPVNASSGFVGVMGFDFTIADLDRIILQNKILQSGYAFLADIKGNIIAHPRVTRSQTTVAQLETVEAELGAPAFAWADWLASATNVPLLTRIRKIAIQQPWLLYGCAVPGSNMVVGLLVPEGETAAAAKSTQSKLSATNDKALIAVLVASIIAAVLIFFLVFWAAKHFTLPIREFSEYLQGVSKMDPKVESGQKVAKSRNVEFRAIGQNLERIALSIKLANEELYKGNKQQAMQLFDVGEEVMRENGNRRGLGICYNNKAFLYQRDGNNDKAEEYYRKAIAEAEACLLDNDDDVKQGAKIALANRKMNLGVLYSEKKQADKARDLYSEALTVHRDNDNIQGILQVSSNINQLLLSQGRLDEAETKINQMIKELENRAQGGKGLEKVQQLMSFALMNRGILEYEKRNYGIAAANFVECLLAFPKLQPGISNCCMGYLRKMYSATQGQLPLPPKLQPMLVPPARLFFFVLDISGSMGGDPIEACRKSIIGILDNQLGENDYFALTTFNATINPVLGPTIKRGNVGMMKNIVMNKTDPETETAFYDAMCDTFQKFDNTKETKDKKETWIIALTDGADNKSYDQTGKRAAQLARSTYANLIVIMVGALKNADVIQNICSAVPQKGNAIQVGREGAEIVQAFDKAMSFVGNVNLEEL